MPDRPVAAAPVELPTSVEAALLRDLAPLDPGPAGARIRQRVLERIRPPQPDAAADANAAAGAAAAPFIDIRAHEGWRKSGPGIEIKVLNDDGHSAAWLVRLAAGATLPAHDHDAGAEECLVLEGRVWLNGVNYGPGDWQLAARGSSHGPVRSDEGCLLFLRSATLRGRGHAHAR
jgi:quercetin dioxygenase-like cupin family protein